MKHSTRTLQDRMKNMAPYGFTWLTVEYEPCTGNFEVHGENPLLLGIKQLEIQEV